MMYPRFLNPNTYIKYKLATKRDFDLLYLNKFCPNYYLFSPQIFYFSANVGVPSINYVAERNA